MKLKLKKTLTALAMASMALATPALAQLSGNVLVNGDFEADPQPGFGNHTNVNVNNQPTGWTFGTGARPNLVKVDGPGGLSYANNGPESDASAPGAGIDQYYLDITNGRNDFYQSFVPKCSGEVVFGGSFSTRANQMATASVSIREGDGLTGSLVGQTSPIPLPAGRSKTDPWVSSSFTANLQAGQTYSFVVRMNNNANFDNGFVKFQTNCPHYDDFTIINGGTIELTPLPLNPNILQWLLNGGLTDGPANISTCCPPWDDTRLEGSLYYNGSGGISDPYTLTFNPGATINAQMQAYINYLNALDPGITTITLSIRLKDKGQTPNAPGLGMPVSSYHFVTWTAGSNTSPSSGTPNFFTMPDASLQVNNWYLVQTKLRLNDDNVAFSNECSESYYMVNVQVMGGTNKNGSRSSASPYLVIKTLKNGRITSQRLDQAQMSIEETSESTHSEGQDGAVKQDKADNKAQRKLQKKLKKEAKDKAKNKMNKAKNKAKEKAKKKFKKLFD